ncbi:class I SAM-dependent methyltransferase [Marivita sp.]|uniref:class I SAM-dependent methyltransferase n=1 Tax=Marivita sp. TaxID=2003365 RepID=UPI0025B852CC|nr:class I SAM-dependent methyltransferase [Marivita sp.]
MALPDTLAARLIETVKENELSGRIAMLGRQRWIGKRRKRSAALLENVLEKYLHGISESELANPSDQYSEIFFEKIGFSKVDSIDASEFENASIVQDLSCDIPEELEEKFDVIYDGGTCEHIFDISTAYRNIDKMLKPHGVLIGHSPCNNWINHSFYQINPELVYAFWERSMGYEVLRCQLQPILPMYAKRVVKMTNPNITGKRPRLSDRVPDGGIILDYAVRKPRVSGKTPKAVYQTDYENRWESISDGEE